MKKIFCLLSAIAFALTTGASACDLCGCYTPQLESFPTREAVVFGESGGVMAGGQRWTSGLYGAVAEQFTHFGTLQLNGNEVANATSQYLNSSITQLVGGYAFTSRFALQVNLPLIYRGFRRPEGFEIQEGTVAGLGDVSLLGQVLLFQIDSGGSRSVNFADPKSPQIEVREPDFTLSGMFTGGLKFPTGATSRLKEEFHEVEVEGAPESGIHGHDLTLGTGSYDGILGGQLALRYKSFFLQQELQFTLRTEGAHQYHFANDLSWSGGPGYYFLRGKRATVGLQAVFSGEYKNVDRFQGRVTADTGITSFFLGPRIIASLGKVSAEVAAEFPLAIENTALQAVPSYRVNGAIAIHF